MGSGCVFFASRRPTRFSTPLMALRSARCEPKCLRMGMTRQPSRGSYLKGLFRAESARKTYQPMRSSSGQVW